MKENHFTKGEELLKAAAEKPRLLLHACCAPCSSACLEYLKEFCDITVFFYNPNMSSLAEYEKRAKELQRLSAEMFPDGSVKVIIAPYDPENYEAVIQGLQNEKEGGKRCEKCFELRLRKTAELAKKEAYDFFTTTLTISPLKNAEKLNTIGYRMEEETGARFLPSDFKKKGGYLRSIELSKEYSLYRQDFCGCRYSYEERQKQKESDKNETF